mmetsp:Transcript_51924/g.110340  ORF Transcript_51924/g.110340 Transcript_51924/m.110340 type:complete len:182 (-) Transcript_51924:422-967(-)
MEQTAQTVMAVRRSAPYKLGRFTIVKEWLEPVECFAEPLDVDDAGMSLGTAVEAPTTLKPSTTPTTPTTPIPTDVSSPNKISDLPSLLASGFVSSEKPKQQQPIEEMEQDVKNTTTTTTKNDACVAVATTRRTSSARKTLNVAETKLCCLSRSSSSTSTSAGSDFRSLDSETSLLSVVASP